MGLDDSNNSWKALERAAIIAASLGDRLKRLVLVNVLDVTRYCQQLANGEQELDINTELLKRALRKLIKYDIDPSKITTLQKPGDPAEVLVDEVKKSGAELVFMGRRDRGAISELFMGSVSSRLISHCQEQTIVLYG